MFYFDDNFRRYSLWVRLLRYYENIIITMGCTHEKIRYYRHLSAYIRPNKKTSLVTELICLNIDIFFFCKQYNLYFVSNVWNLGFGDGHISLRVGYLIEDSVR